MRHSSSGEFFLNLMVRLGQFDGRAIGIRGRSEHDTVHDVSGLRQILDSSASAGQISGRQRLFAENVLSLVALEVRHVMLLRVDVAYLSL